VISKTPGRINASKFFMSLAALAVLTAFAVLVPAPARAADAAVKSGAFTAAQKEEMNTVIHDYLMNNPTVIMDAVAKYRSDKQANDEKAFDSKIQEKSAELYKKPGEPVTGNKNGDVTMVEFFDYNCGYCKHALKDVQALVKDDKNLRVVFKDFPILAESSHTAARYALAAGRQGKYWEFHQAMMEHNGAITEDGIMQVAKSIGLDTEKLKKDAADPAIRAQIESNLALGRDIGIQGTPGFVINGTVLRGAYGLEAMQKAIADVRAKK
jgi:protein-disulfide isomerase